MGSCLEGKVGASLAAGSAVACLVAGGAVAGFAWGAERSAMRSSGLTGPRSMRGTSGLLGAVFAFAFVVAAVAAARAWLSIGWLSLSAG